MRTEITFWLFIIVKRQGVAVGKFDDMIGNLSVCGITIGL